MDPFLQAVLAEQAEDRKLMARIEMAKSVAPHSGPLARMLEGFHHAQHQEHKVRIPTGKPGRTNAA